jgi:hypothetical protein
MFTTCSCANPDCMINGCLIARNKRDNGNLIERYKVDYIVETNTQHKECRLCKASQTTAIKLGWDGFENAYQKDNDPVIWMEKEILKHRKDRTDLILWLKDMISASENNAEKLEEENLPTSWITASSSESDAYRKVINYLKNI